jgi:hypothetical protein
MKSSLAEQIELFEGNYTDFLEDFKVQWAELTDTSRVDFDERWSWDPFLQTFTSWKYKYNNNYHIESDDIQNTLSPLEEEILDVKSLSEKQIMKLKPASDLQIGMELFHLFIVDMLGRDSPAARIFEAKTDGSFQTSMVVTQNAKYIAWLCVLFINTFFIYFTVTRCMQRSYHWQKTYLISCVIEVICEVCFYETSECLWVNYIIPKLVSHKVNDSVNSLIKTIELAFSGQLQPIPIMDTPFYFHISRKVAEYYSHLFESSVILSFHTYLPHRDKDIYLHEYEYTDSSVPFFVSLRNRFLFNMFYVLLLYLGNLYLTNIFT